MFQEASSIRSNQKPGTVSHHLIGSNGFKSAIKRDFHSSLQLRQQLRCDKKKNRFLCEAENRNDVINVIVIAHNRISLLKMFLVSDNFSSYPYLIFKKESN